MWQWPKPSWKSASLPPTYWTKPVGVKPNVVTACSVYRLSWDRIWWFSLFFTLSRPTSWLLPYTFFIIFVIFRRQKPLYLCSLIKQRRHPTARLFKTSFPPRNQSYSNKETAADSLVKWPINKTVSWQKEILHSTISNNRTKVNFS